MVCAMVPAGLYTFFAKKPIKYIVTRSVTTMKHIKDEYVRILLRKGSLK